MAAKEPDDGIQFRRRFFMRNPVSVAKTIRTFAEIVVEEVPDARNRKRILKRLDEAVKNLMSEAKTPNRG